jgi:hypothetical protein
MIRTRLALLIAALLTVALATPSWAEVSVGDRPSYELTDVDGNEVTSEEAIGQLVMFLFFSAQDDDSQALLAGSREIVVATMGADASFVAVCTDNSRSASRVRRLLRQVEINGSMIYDTDETGLQLARNWGITSVPSIVLIAANGSVAGIWDGNDFRDVARSNRDEDAATRVGMVIADIANTVMQSREEYPPISRDRLEAASGQIDAALDALAQDDLEGALAAMRGFPAKAASYFPDTAAKYRRLARAVAPFGENDLLDARAMVARGEIDAARTKLQELQQRYDGLPLARIMADEILRLEMNDTAVRTKAKIHYERRINRSIARAQGLINAGRRIDAYRKLKFIAEKYRRSEGARRAQDLIRAMEQDPAFEAEQQAYEMRLDCEALLNEVQAAIDENDIVKAKSKLKTIISRYPDSQYAQTAQEKLDELES